MIQRPKLEIVNFQVTAVGQIPKPQFSKREISDRALPPAPQEMRTTFFNPAEASQIPVFRRSVLMPGTVIDGPAVIEEKTSTTVLYPGQRAAIDGYLNIEIASGR